MGPILAFLKALPGFLSIIWEVLSLSRSLFRLIKANREEAHADSVEVKLGEALRAAAKQTKEKKMKAIGSIQNALSRPTT